MKILKSGVAVLAACAGLLVSGVSAAADPDMWDGQWHFAITPYGWFPSIGGKFNIPLPSGATSAPTVSVNPSSYLSDLQFAAMVFGDARKGDWAIFTDIVYADLANLNSQVKTFHGPNGNVSIGANIDTNFSLQELVWTVGAGYTVARSPRGNLDLFVGARYGNIKQSIDLAASGSNGILNRYLGKTYNADLWDGIVGVRGALTLSDDGKWFMPYEFDVGGGTNSNVTYNGILAVGYRFNWGDVLLGYRYLAYDQPSDKPIQDLYMSGPALGVRFAW